MLHGEAVSAVVHSLEKQGKPIPDHYCPPDVLPGFDDWIADFADLGTNRIYDGGPIPSEAIARHVSGWPETDAWLFKRLVRAMDNALLEAMADARREDGPGGLPQEG